MRIRELILNNVIVTSPCKQDEILYVSEKIKEYVIKNNLFPIGPVIYFYDGDETYKVAVQVDRPIEMEESDVLVYADRVVCKKCLYERVCESDLLDTIYYEMKQTAKELGIDEKREFVNFSFDVYGETVTDVYYPIEEVN